MSAEALLPKAAFTKSCVSCGVFVELKWGEVKLKLPGSAFSLDVCRPGVAAHRQIVCVFGAPLGRKDMSPNRNLIASA